MTIKIEQLFSKGIIDIDDSFFQIIQLMLMLGH